MAIVFVYGGALLSHSGYRARPACVTRGRPGMQAKLSAASSERRSPVPIHRASPRVRVREFEFEFRVASCDDVGFRMRTERREARVLHVAGGGCACAVGGCGWWRLWFPISNLQYALPRCPTALARAFVAQANCKKHTTTGQGGGELSLRGGLLFLLLFLESCKPACIVFGRFSFSWSCCCWLWRCWFWLGLRLLLCWHILFCFRGWSCGLRWSLSCLPTERYRRNHEEWG